MVTRGIDVWAKLEGFDDTFGWLDGLKTLNSRSWIIGTNVEYSVYVEFGTSNMDAQPYLFRAADDVMRHAQRIWKRWSGGLEGYLKELALRIERLAKKYCPVDTGNLRASLKAEKI